MVGFVQSKFLQHKECSTKQVDQGQAKKKLPPALLGEIHFRCTTVAERKRGVCMCVCVSVILLFNVKDGLNEGRSNNKS